ncbi:MAG TPA: putative O-glycosylation ligase, exosortase A system-associated [Candidatus Polarisedimenticolaceae bacterium]|nr:putative O-glycosylation ligase, exosortase A system-associated [Candidatus Polarisedimenticolaceae bacterium]
MRDILLVVVVFGALPIVLLRPQIGVILWCWLSYMNPQTLAHGLARGMRFAAFVAVALIAGLLISGERKRLPRSPVVGLWFLWVGWQCITTWLAFYPTIAEVALNKTLKIQLITLCIMLIMWSRPRIDATVWVIVLSLGYFGVRGGLMTLVTGGQYRVWGPDGGFIAGNNELGLALTMTLPLMRYLQLSTRTHWIRLGLLGVMVLTVVAIIGTYSRGGFLAASAMGIVLALKSRHRLRLLVVGAVLIPLALGLMPERWFERMGTIKTYEQDASAMSRINSWNFAINLANDNPVFGGGYGTFQAPMFAKYAPDPTIVYDAHSIYFEVLAEHGYGGLAIFVALAFASWRAATRTAAAAANNPNLIWAHDLSRMLQVSIVGYAVGGAFLGLAYFDLFYNLIALVVLTQAVVREGTAAVHAGGPSVEGREVNPGTRPAPSSLSPSRAGQRR